MAQVYGHPTASRFQQTAVTCTALTWTKLEGSTALANRIGTQLYNKGQAASVKLYFTYTYDGATPTGLSSSVKLCPAIETGSYHFEPNGIGMTLWGRTQAATARIIVIEYAA